MSHEATTSRRSRRATRLLGAALGTLVLAGATAGAANAQLPVTEGDPRIGLAGAPDDTAGKAARGLQHLKNLPKPAALSNTNSDAAFQGNYAFAGNYNGFAIYDISNPDAPVQKTVVSCPGGQNDLSVYKNLLFVSVESATAGRVDCSSDPRNDADPNKKLFRGIRVFDISNIEVPRQVAAVQTCRGSHTHTLLRPTANDPNIYIYNSATSTVRTSAELAGCDGYNSFPATGADPSKWKIDVIKVPVDAPQNAAVVGGPRLFADATGKVDGLQNDLPSPQHPCASATPACGPGTNASTGGATWSPQPITDACHDITVYEKLNLAAGACEGNGLLIDISDRANPKRIDAVADPKFAYWHGATFSNDGKAVLFTDEWGGGSAARCRATDQLSWGADAIYEIVNGKLVFRSYYKLPVAQTQFENCVSHVGNLVPVPGRNVMVQAWYQGGVSLIDWTDLSNPKEIGFFDRGPVNPNAFASGGFWSTYWYKGRIYGTEIARGFDSFKLTPTDNLTAAEIAGAERVAPAEDRLNAQSQDAFTFTAAPVQGTIGGTVPATLSLSLGAPASFGAFTPGVARDYTASSNITVTSSAGDAALIVQDTSPFYTNRLVNGNFALAQEVQVKNNAGVFQKMPAGLRFWGGPTAGEVVPLELKQSIGANDPLRSGSYSKTLTFTLSTTNP